MRVYDPVGDTIWIPFTGARGVPVSGVAVNVNDAPVTLRKMT